MISRVPFSLRILQRYCISIYLSIYLSIDRCLASIRCKYMHILKPFFRTSTKRNLDDDAADEPQTECQKPQRLVLALQGRLWTPEPSLALKGPYSLHLRTLIQRHMSDCMIISLKLQSTALRAARDTALGPQLQVGLCFPAPYQAARLSLAWLSRMQA